MAVVSIGGDDVQDFGKARPALVQGLDLGHPHLASRFITRNALDTHRKRPTPMRFRHPIQQAIRIADAYRAAVDRGSRVIDILALIHR